MPRVLQERGVRWDPGIEGNWGLREIPSSQLPSSVLGPRHPWGLKERLTLKSVTVLCAGAPAPCAAHWVLGGS